MPLGPLRSKHMCTLVHICSLKIICSTVIHTAHITHTHSYNSYSAHSPHQYTHIFTYWASRRCRRTPPRGTPWVRVVRLVWWSSHRCVTGSPQQFTSVAKFLLVARRTTVRVFPSPDSKAVAAARKYVFAYNPPG